MGKRGPAPTPTAVLKMRGSWRATTRGGEPQFPPELPRCPAHLDAEARREWKRLGALLLGQGLVTAADRAALAAYCVAWSRWVAAEEALANMGPVLRSAEGNLYQNPYLPVANRALEQLRRLGALFGLNPSDRSRIQAPPASAEADELEQFLANRG